jgi:hypothetical protein
VSAHQIVLTDADTTEPEFALTVGLADAAASREEPIVWLNAVSLAEGTNDTQHINVAPTFGIYVDDLLGALSLLSDEWRFPRVPVVAVAEPEPPHDPVDASLAPLVMERCLFPHGNTAGQPCRDWHHFTPDTGVINALPRWYHCPPGSTA